MEGERAQPQESLYKTMHMAVEGAKFVRPYAVKSLLLLIISQDSYVDKIP